MIRPLVIADLMRGTGRYNLAQGASDTVQGVGASLGGLVAGVIVDHLGYSADFLTFGAAICVALAALPFTTPQKNQKRLLKREFWDDAGVQGQGSTAC